MEPYDCQVCTNSFRSKNSLKLHYVVKHIRKRMTCDVCEKRFSDPSLFKSHRLFHELESYVCSVCSQQFSDYLRYKKHVRLHEEVEYVSLITYELGEPVSRLWTVRYPKNLLLSFICMLQTGYRSILKKLRLNYIFDRFCGLVVRVLGYRSRSPGSIPGTTRKKKSSGSGTGSTQPREYNWGATW
jgi:hypothetical protein